MRRWRAVNEIAPTGALPEEPKPRFADDPMSDALKQEVLDYVRGHNTMTLATCASDVPWAATVFYASDDFRLYFLSAPGSRHCRNLSGNSRAGVTIQEDYKDWREIKGVQLEGKVRLVDSEIERAEAMAIYARKYPEVVKIFANPGSGVLAEAFLKVKLYCLTPTKIFFIDNARGFGQRQEWIVGE